MTELHEPNKWQLEVLESDARLRVVAGGRSVGKTAVCRMAALQYANARVLWLAPNFPMLKNAQDFIGSGAIWFFRFDDSLDPELKGLVFEVVIVDEFLATSLENNLRILIVLDKLRQRYSKARWLVTGTPQPNSWEVPFPAHWQIPTPLKLLYDDAVTYGVAWRVASTDPELMSMIPENFHRSEILGEFPEEA